MKHDAEQDGEQEAEQSGTSVEQAGTSTEQHVERDVGTDETRLKRAVQWKLDGKTYRQIEEGLGVPKSSLHRYLRRNLPNMKLEPSEPQVENNVDPDETDEPIDGEAETGSSHPLLVPASPSFPQNGVLFDYGMLQAIEDTLPTKQGKANFRAAVALSEEKARLNRNNGHDEHNSNGHTKMYSDNPYTTRIWQLAEARDLKEVLGLGKNEKNDDLERKFERLEDKIEKLGTKSSVPDVTKQIVDALRLGFDMAPKGGGPDQLTVYRSGRQDEQKTFENAVKQGETNSLDLQLEQMKENERIDFARLAFDEKKWERKEEAEGKKWELVEKGFKALASEPVAGFLQKVGGGVADHLHGPGGRIKLDDVVCPNCGAKLKVNPKLDMVICNSCGAGLSRQPGSPPQAEPQPQQPQAETVPPEESTEEQKPKIDITSDEGVKK
jgi:hypothetical protein